MRQQAAVTASCIATIRLATGNAPEANPPINLALQEAMCGATCH
jgi:hypothetical protein